eukprot:TRINITY_DN607_c0_g1_i2.p1 TRINITY_DN607_c0_g1~~TRINITY_DN607_c0_g1_i2.p1  ORF type:complete len:456 (+),score=29.95 TRINITY_DN607_c0_g1_i2:253-1620(+)
MADMAHVRGACLVLLISHVRCHEMTSNTDQHRRLLALDNTLRPCNSSVVEPPGCYGNDCATNATCPIGQYVQSCSSTPKNQGDGISVTSNACTAHSSGPRNRQSPRATCTSSPTTVVESGPLYLDNQEVTASCPAETDAIQCTCHSPWSVCGTTTEFYPSGNRCTKHIRVSDGRRRGTGGGAGAKVYAICRAPTALDGSGTVFASGCYGNDCATNATCPIGQYVQSCSSTPRHQGDGISVTSNACTAHSSGPRNRQSAEATCCAVPTTVVESGPLYLDNQEVTASCPAETDAIQCTCHSPWSVCGTTTEFYPSGNRCTKHIRVSDGRRRGTGGGAGAKVYAICRPTTDASIVAPTEAPTHVRTVTKANGTAAADSSDSSRGGTPVWVIVLASIGSCVTVVAIVVVVVLYRRNQLSVVLSRMYSVVATLEGQTPECALDSHDGTEKLGFKAGCDQL